MRVSFGYYGINNFRWIFSIELKLVISFLRILLP
jgi:hypothetical protein